ncbi:YcxB family protein [Rhodocytophaga rosea]|uniref:YcxB family protein n=1 Tax=Rhodocytophaga rosea TaxID=2704465 RepID=A0A6C0GCN4_9BACT|nr:YcxB family protein [Rhodocytophaga rosea]QHT65592.1 YcxB family protein [Rhodocytophaga rosea]
MIVKTRKYKLENSTYIKLAMKHLLRTQWYWAAVPLGIIILNVILNLTGVYPNIWIYFMAPLAIVLYLLFWAIQFTGVTQLEQNKVLFQKLLYEIDGRQILIKLNSKEGMQMKWEMIKKAYKEKDHFLLVVSKAQFIHLPYSIFNSENDIKFTESLLRRKNLIA